VLCMCKRVEKFVRKLGGMVRPYREKVIYHTEFKMSVAERGYGSKALGRWLLIQ
jgi:hypothetical protein